MEWVWWTSNSVNIIVNFIGTVGNSVLIYMILKKTPAPMISYSVLLFNNAICDLLICITTVLALQRTIYYRSSHYNIYSGPCKYFHVEVCSFMQSFTFTSHFHGIHSLLVSFAYRYYVLKHNAPQTYKVVVTIILVYLPTFFVFVVSALSSEDQAQMKAEIGKNLGYDISSDTVSSPLTNSWGEILISCYMALPPLPVYIGILILRRLIISMISAQRAMSERSRQLHKQLLRALAVQACLPLLYLGGIVVTIISSVKIYYHPLMDYSFIYVFAPIPAINPLVTLYFVGPYRIWIREKFLMLNKIIAKDTAVTSVVALEQRGTIESQPS